ncbi:unnamed protein product, partial [Musa acuminata subsp. burmannicoides]
ESQLVGLEIRRGRSHGHHRSNQDLFDSAYMINLTCIQSVQATRQQNKRNNG